MHIYYIAHIYDKCLHKYTYIIYNKWVGKKTIRIPYKISVLKRLREKNNVPKDKWFSFSYLDFCLFVFYFDATDQTYSFAVSHVQL